MFIRQKCQAMKQKGYCILPTLTSPIRSGNLWFIAQMKLRYCWICWCFVFWNPNNHWISKMLCYKMMIIWFDRSSKTHPKWLAWFLPTWRSVPLITLGFCPYLMVGSSHQDGWCPSDRLDHPSIDYPGPVATWRCSLEKFRSAHLSCVCCVCNTWKLSSRELYYITYQV